MGRTARIAGYLLLISSLSPSILAGQDADRYPGPFPGGYPAMSGIGGSGKMYMESYFPPPVTASPTYPAWSPDGGSIAFAYQGRIWAVPAEGGVARQLTSGAGYHSQPSWSSDGRHIAYASDIDLNLDIFLLDLESEESRRLTEDPALDMRPRFSPDGSRILFTTGRDGTFDLWAYDLEAGGAAPVIAHPTANDMAGDWIGDTGDIVFVSKRGEAALGSGSLWRWSADTGEAELLIRIETNYQASPVVAPHGGSVAYVTDASGNNDIYQVPTYRAGASQDRSSPGIQQVRLTHTRTDEYFPAWSPDGERLVYARNGGSAGEERTTDGGMGFGLYTTGRGGGEPVPVRIEDYAWSEPTGRVQVRVSGEDGRRLPSRIYLQASDGRSYFPDGSFPRVLSGPEDYYFHTDGSFSVTLPVGPAELEVWRGFEYEPVTRTVDVRAGEWSSVDVRLERWIDMAADGWYSGDNHIHPNYGGHYFVTPLDLGNKALAEDLNVANGMIANYWANSRVEDLEHFLGHPHPHPDPRTIVYYNEEYRPNFFAHMSLLNLVQLITPVLHRLRGDGVPRTVSRQRGGAAARARAGRHRRLRPPVRAQPPRAGPRARRGARVARRRDPRAGRLRGCRLHLERRTGNGRDLVSSPQHRLPDPGHGGDGRDERHVAAPGRGDDALLRPYGGGGSRLRRVGRRDGRGPRLRDERTHPDARRGRHGDGRGTGGLRRRERDGRGHRAFAVRDGAA